MPGSLRKRPELGSNAWELRVFLGRAPPGSGRPPGLTSGREMGPLGSRLRDRTWLTSPPCITRGAGTRDDRARRAVEVAGARVGEPLTQTGQRTTSSPNRPMQIAERRSSGDSLNRRRSEPWNRNNPHQVSSRSGSTMCQSEASPRWPIRIPSGSTSMYGVVTIQVTARHGDW